MAIEVSQTIEYRGGQLYDAHMLESKFFNSSQQKPELRPTKDFEVKYNKVKAKLAHLSSGASTSKSSLVKNKGLITEAYEWDEEDVFSNDNETVEVKVLMALADDESGVVGKESVRNDEWLFEVEGFNLSNHDTGRIIPSKSQVKVTDSSVNVTDYDSADESAVCSTPLLPL
ncbi:hypothetical protein Tco_0271914 [Tanacetum coccineum]